MARHGRGRRTTYQAWASAKQRCHNPRNKDFPNYGARGIVVCDRWRDDYRAFLADMGERPQGMTLDRRDVNGNYEPGNCRWITQAEQLRNTRRTVFVEYDGQRMALVDAARAAGLDYKLVEGRHRLGWPVARLFEPPRPNKRRRASTATSPVS
jgi:hypothetical protein